MNIELIPFSTLSLEEKMRTRAWRNQENVAKYFKIKHISEEMHLGWINSMHLSCPRNIAYIISAEGHPVGVTYFHSVDYQLHICDWGIYLHDESYRGKGIGYIALGIMLNKAKNELNIKTVYLDVHIDNINAISLYERHGFIKCQEQHDISFVRYYRTFE